MKLITQVFRSKKEEEMYLYVKKEDGLSQVPKELLTLFGRAEAAMVLLLTAEKKLAHADVKKVMESITEKGFYLQLPPRTEQDDEMVRIRSLNSKLAGR